MFVLFCTTPEKTTVHSTEFHFDSALLTHTAVENRGVPLSHIPSNVSLSSPLCSCPSSLLLFSALAVRHPYGGGEEEARERGRDTQTQSLPLTVVTVLLHRDLGSAGLRLRVKKRKERPSHHSSPLETQQPAPKYAKYLTVRHQICNTLTISQNLMLIHPSIHGVVLFNRPPGVF